MTNEIKSIVKEIMDSQKWTRFEEVTESCMHPDMAKLVDKLGPLYRDSVPFKIYTNNLYQVAVYEARETAPGWPMMIYLSIKRLDKSIVRDWRHLQWIKNELVGKEHEAVELFPAESRLVDGANQFHLWALADPSLRFPFGFRERCVSNISEMGTKQRPFPEGQVPPDCKSLADHVREQGVTL